jgi:hypothetical protein
LILYEIACQHLSALERLAFIVDKIAQSVQRYQDLAALFASHAAVREAVGRLYCELLRLCTCMVKYQTRRLRYILNPFGKEFESISESVDHRAAEIDRAAQAAHFQEAKEVREKLAQEMRGVWCLYTKYHFPLRITDHPQSKICIESGVGYVLPQSRMTCSDTFLNIQMDPVTGFCSQINSRDGSRRPETRRWRLSVALVVGRVLLLLFSSNTCRSTDGSCTSSATERLPKQQRFAY